MRTSSPFGRAVPICATVTTALLVGIPAAAAENPDEAEEHCVVSVEGNGTGELEPSDLGCFPTLTEALESAGVPPAGREPALSPLGTVTQLSATRVIGTHFDGANRTGSSISVVGSDCAGGHINLSSTWTNRISSTQNGCGLVRFFDGFDKTGSWEDATFNLSSLNNQANSIQYGS